jgi:peptide/nickel transport system substrate-binding protein
MTRRWLLALLAAVLTACAPRSETTLRLSQAEDLYSLDPDAAADSRSRAVLCNIYEGLVGFDKELAIVPSLAAGWTTPDDHTWDFQLRPGVRFHDGRRLAAVDVKFSLDRVGGAAPHLDPVSGFSSEVLDEHRIRLRTVRPDPLMLNRLTQLLIVPAGIDPNERPVGTGPYRVVSRRTGRLELEAFPEHWRGRPRIDRLVFLAVSGSGLAGALARREIDVYRLLPAALRTRLASLPGFRVQGRRGLAITYLWFDCAPRREGRANPFADARVRRAMSLALDRTEIVRRLGGLDVPERQLIPKGVLGWAEDRGAAPLDLDGARRLLAAAGHSGGLEVRLTHGDNEPHRTVASAVSDMLARIGVRVVREELPWVRLLEARRDRRLSFFVLDWTFDDGDAWTFLMASLHSRAGPNDLRSTNAGCSSAELDHLIEESRHATTIQDRLIRYGAALRLAHDDAFLVPVTCRHDLYAVSRRVRFEPRLDGKLVAAEMGLALGP